MRGFVVSVLAAVAVATAAAGAASARAAAVAPQAELGPIKTYLVRHTGQLAGFTREFRAVANRYYAAARAERFDYAALGKSAKVRADLAKAKKLWIAGNPLYERVEGVVAGTPSLAVYDVILDAGSSAAEDPASAVPFDLELANGKVLRKPGNLFNLTEGLLWGTLPRFTAGKTDLDGDGLREFGEVLPDAYVFKGAADAFVRYAAELDAAA